MMRREISCKAKLLCFLITEGICCTLIYTGRWDVPCFFEQWFHIPCLGCGMTEAIAYLLQGEPVYAMQFHPFVLPFVFFMIIAHTAILLYFADRKRLFDWVRRKLCDRRAAAGIVVLWLVRIWLY